MADDYSEVSWDTPGAGDTALMEWSSIAPTTPKSPSSVENAVSSDIHEASNSEIQSNNNINKNNGITSSFSYAAAVASSKPLSIRPQSADPTQMGSSVSPLSSGIAHGSSNINKPLSPDTYDNSPLSPINFSKTNISNLPLASEIPTISVPFSVQVIDPSKQGEGSNSYVSYQIKFDTSLEGYVHVTDTIRRRFQDFLWLQKCLKYEYPASIHPPLPGKHRIEYFTGDRFSTEFLEKRRLQLEIYLQRVCRHPQLQHSSYLKSFLTTEGNITNDIPHNTSDSTVLENISDTIMHTIYKPKANDERFVLPKESLVKFEDNLLSVDKLHTKLLKLNEEIRATFGEMSVSVIGLSSLEKEYENQLTEFGSVLARFSHLQNDKNGTEDLDYISNIREYISYCRSVRQLFKHREQKQIETDEIRNYLDTCIRDHERTLAGRRSPGITGFLKEKYNDMRSLDQEVHRKEKLSKLISKIDNLKEQVEKSTKESANFSDIVLTEIDQFNRNKIADFKGFLNDYTDTQLQYHLGGFKYWDHVVNQMANDSFNSSSTISSTPPSNIVSPLSPSNPF